MNKANSRGRENEVTSIQDARELREEVERKAREASDNDRKIDGKKRKKLDEIKESLIVKKIRESENGMADLFVYYFKKQFLYDCAIKKWMKYSQDANHWELDVINKVLHNMDTLIQILEDEYTTIHMVYDDYINEPNEDYFKQEYNKILGSIKTRINSLRTLNYQCRILTLAQARGLGIKGDAWDQDGWLLPFDNGVLDLSPLKKGKDPEFGAGKPEDLIKRYIPGEWKGIDERCPAFDRFLSDIFDDDQEMINFIWELFGLWILGVVVEKILIIFWGELGDNAKTTLLEFFGEILGRHFASSMPTSLILQGKERSPEEASPALMSLEGKRLVWMSEAREGSKYDQEKLKQLTGNDTITGRNLMVGPHSFIPAHTMVQLGNSLLHTNAYDRAMWKRLVVVPFTISFVAHPKETYERKADPYIKSKLRQEASGVIAGCVRGLKRYLERKHLEYPQKVQDAKAEYRRNEDILQQFVDASCEVGNDFRSRLQPLYKHYEIFCREINNKPMGRGTFSKNLGRMFNKRNPSRGNYEFKGIQPRKNWIQEFRSNSFEDPDDESREE